MKERSGLRWLAVLMGMWVMTMTGRGQTGDAADRLAGDLGKAWELLNEGAHEKAVAFVDGLMETIGDVARAEAGRMKGFAPAGRERDYHLSYWNTAADFLAARKKFVTPAAKD